jgi:predicted transposase YdaD
VKTDKQFYRLFNACPQLAYELAGLPDPGPCRVQSENFKEIARTADLVLDPKNKKHPSCILEVQFQPDEHIYTRTAIEMALAQRSRRNQAITGIILFRHRKIDPATRPWNQIIKAVYLDEELEKLRKTNPEHVLLDLLAPIYLDKQSELEAKAHIHYHRLRQRPLPELVRQNFIDIFESWIIHRLKTQDPKLLAMTLHLPPPDFDVKDTPLGRAFYEAGHEAGHEAGRKEGREKGREEGREKGREEGRADLALAGIQKLGARHFGKLPRTLDTAIRKLPGKLKVSLFEAMMDMGSWKDVSAWIAKKNRA